MRSQRFWIPLATAVALLGACPPALGEGGSVPLRFESGVGALTPQRVREQGQRMTLNGGEGTLPIGVHPLRVAGRGAGRSFQIGVDANGDGTIGDNEWLSPGPDGTVSVTVSLPQAVSPIGQAAITFADLSIGGSARALMGRYYATGALRGEVNGVPVRLIDANLDGRITQDGQDAIVVGAAGWAVPLRQVHRIGAGLYRLGIDNGQGTLSFTPVDDAELGEVRIPQTQGLRALVLESDQGAFDVLANGAAMVPAGEYRLSYGLFGPRNLTVTPGRAARVYPIRAGVRNTLAIGGKPTVVFQAGFADGTLTVQPRLAVTGAGGEIYEANFSRQDPTPTVQILAADRPADTGQMGFG